MTHEERIAAEHRAGAEAMMKAVSEKVLADGMKELRRRFPGVLADPNMCLVGNTEWTVSITVQCATGAIMRFTDPFKGWPSDLLITEIALVV